MTTKRLCSFLGCPARYDAVMVATGQASAVGWRQWNTLNLRMCPNHAPLWAADGAPGPHAPGLDTSVTPAVVTCGCGWRQDAPSPTAGKAAEAYLLHLHDATRADAARAAFERAGTILDDTATTDAIQPDEFAELVDRGAEIVRDGYNVGLETRHRVDPPDVH